MRHLLKICFLFFALSAFGQDQPAPQSDDSSVYNLAGIDTKPDFPGGLMKFYEYIGANYNIPAELKDSTGNVFVTFVIEKDGSLTDIKILRDIGHGTGEEAVRVLKESPKWIPGSQNGQSVRVQYTLPIKIKAPSGNPPVRKF